jgi:hypothetical protein
MATCEYIGPEQKEWPFTMCGCQALTGKAYCGEHYWKVYQKGSAIAGKRKERAIEKELEAITKAQEADLENDYA